MFSIREVEDGRKSVYTYWILKKVHAEVAYLNL